MTPEEALGNVDSVLAQVRVNRQEQQVLKESMAVLKLQIDLAESLKSIEKLQEEEEDEENG